MYCLSDVMSEGTKISCFLSSEDISNQVKESLSSLGWEPDKPLEIDVSVMKKAKEKLNEKMTILIFPFNEKRLQPAHYELCLGDEVYVSGQDVPLNLSKQKSGYVVIRPGEIAILSTMETVYVPRNLIAFISIKVSYKFKGLVNISGFHVDPGFMGKLLFTVYNAGPNDVVIKRGDEVFMIMFAHLTNEVDKDKAYKGKHQYLTRINPEYVAVLRGTPVSPKSLDQRVRKIELWLYVLTATVIPIVVSVLVAVLVLFLNMGGGR
jgi:dCTP deaminase